MVDSSLQYFIIVPFALLILLFWAQVVWTAVQIRKLLEELNELRERLSKLEGYIIEVDRNRQ